MYTDVYSILESEHHNFRLEKIPLIPLATIIVYNVLKYDFYTHIKNTDDDKVCSRVVGTESVLCS